MGDFHAIFNEYQMAWVFLCVYQYNLETGLNLNNKKHDSKNERSQKYNHDV